MRSNLHAKSQVIRRCSGKHGTRSSCNASSSSGDGFDINRRTIADMLIANSPYPHVVHNKTASLRHAYFAAQVLVHVPQLCRRLIALAYEWNDPRGGSLPFTKARTTPNRTRLQQGFAIDKMGFRLKLQGSNREAPMFALGQKQTFDPRNAKSALPPEADIR